MPPLTLAKQRFGRLVALRKQETEDVKHSYWKCICDCGTFYTVRGDRLRSGITTECLDCSRNRQVKHGHCSKGNSKTYQVWANMLDRCYNPDNKNYYRYGGRGIGVCSEWIDSFEAFLRDMGAKPDGLSLDREDNHVGYHKANCRWATRKEQQNNLRSNRYITYDGHTLTVAEWATKIGVSNQVLYERLKKNWPLRKALSTTGAL